MPQVVVVVAGTVVDGATAVLVELEAMAVLSGVAVELGVVGWVDGSGPVEPHAVGNSAPQASAARKICRVDTGTYRPGDE